MRQRLAAQLTGVADRRPELRRERVRVGRGCRILMHGDSKPRFAVLKPGDTLVRQGETGSDVYLVLDGVIRVDRDGAPLAEYGPGAVLGSGPTWRPECVRRPWSPSLHAASPRYGPVSSMPMRSPSCRRAHRREEAEQGS